MKRIVSVLMLSLAACTSERHDVGAMCRAPLEVTADDPASKAVRLREALEERAQSAGAKALLAQILEAPPATQYALMSAAAQKHGVAPCPLAELWKP